MHQDTTGRNTNFQTKANFKRRRLKKRERRWVENCLSHEPLGGKTHDGKILASPGCPARDLDAISHVGC